MPMRQDLSTHPVADVVRTDWTYPFTTCALLVRQALDGLQADMDRDRRIHLAEWLRYAVTAVPRLHAQPGQAAAASLPARDGFIGARRVGTRYQQPVLFDFRRDDRGILLVSDRR